MMEHDWPPERRGTAAPAELAERRRAMAGAVAAGAWKAESPLRELLIGGVRALALGQGAGARATIVHFHGGGFRQGCPEMLAPFAATIADRCGVEFICPAYRLAPEHPLPAGLNDGLAVTRALASKEGKPLILSGDSAGGGLAASLAARCAVEQIALAGLILLSPWLDLTVSSDCYQRNAASDPIFSRQSAQEAADQYLQGFPADDPLASPLFAELRSFPPVLIATGMGEVLREDAARFQAALGSASIDAELHLIDGMEHTAAVRSPTLKGSTETIDAVVRFIDRVL